MATVRRYTCNICRDDVLPSPGTDREGFGIHFSSNRPPATGEWFSLRRVSECETHVCLPCATTLHDQLRKVKPATPAKDSHE